MQHYLNLVKEKRVQQKKSVCDKQNVNTMVHKCEYGFHCSGLTNNQWRHLKSILHNLNGICVCDTHWKSVRLMSQCLSRRKIPGPLNRIVVYCKPSSLCGDLSMCVVRQIDHHVIKLLTDPRQFGLSINVILVYAQTEWGQLNHVDSVFASNPNVRDEHKVFTGLCTQWLSSPLEYFCMNLGYNHPG